MSKREAALAAAVALTASVVLAHGNPREELKATVGSANVTVEYGRPSLKGRDMLGQATAGTVWRVGADKATTLVNDAALSFGDVSLAPGSYTLKARKDGDAQWVLLLESDGATAEVPLTAATLEEPVELFTIALSADGSAGTLDLRWGTRSLSTPFSAA